MSSDLERDRLWCRAAVEALDLDGIHALVTAFNAARSVREGQNEQGEVSDGARLRCAAPAASAGVLPHCEASPASPPAFARETPRECPKCNHLPGPIRMPKDILLDYRLVWKCDCECHAPDHLDPSVKMVPPSPPPETRTDATPPRKCFVCGQSERDVFGDAPWLCADHIPEKPAVPPAQPPKRETPIELNDLDNAIYDGTSGMVSRADSRRAAISALKVVSEHVARVERERDAMDAAFQSEVRAYNATKGLSEHFEAERDRLKAECERLRDYLLGVVTKCSPEQTLEQLVHGLAAERDAARQEVKEQDDAIEALEERDKWPNCACVLDSKDSVCMVHSPAVSKALARAEAAEKKLEEEKERVEGCLKWIDLAHAALDAVTTPTRNKFLHTRIEEMTKPAPAPDEAIEKCATYIFETEVGHGPTTVGRLMGILRRFWPSPAVGRGVTAEDVT